MITNSTCSAVVVQNLLLFFEDLLLALAPVFHRVNNPLIISGHTDAIPFKKRFGRQSNWRYQPLEQT